MRKRCRACGGVYVDPDGNGFRYFHSCPPVTTVKAIRDGRETAVPVANLQPTDTIQVTRDGATLSIAVAELKLGDVRLGERVSENPRRRDENVLPATGNGRSGPRDDGDGYDELPA